MSDKTVTLSEEQWRLVSETTTTWLLDYADLNDGNWPEREEYVEALSAFHEALNKA